jgi:hypothetical protein
MAKQNEENLLLRGALSDLGDSNEELKQKITRLEQEVQVGLDTIDRLNGIISKKKEKICVLEKNVDKLETALAKEFDKVYSLERQIIIPENYIRVTFDLKSINEGIPLDLTIIGTPITIAPAELAFHNLMILIINWESSIIERTWPMAEFGTLTTHFQAKFSGFCNLHGNYSSPNAILSFYFSLSDHYKKDLCCQMMKDINIRDQWRKDFSY